jgi:hypothetical protein
LSAERVAAAEIAGYRAELAAARETPATHAPRPVTGAVEFAPIAAMLTDALQQGQRVIGREPDAAITPEAVRGGMVWVATIAMKLMLTFGVWVGLQRGRGTGPTPIPDTARPIIDAVAPALAPRQAARRSQSAVFSKNGRRFGRP